MSSVVSIKHDDPKLELYVLTALRVVNDIVRDTPHSKYEITVYLDNNIADDVLGLASIYTNEIWLNEKKMADLVTLNDVDYNMLSVVLIHEIFHIIGIVGTSVFGVRLIQDDKGTPPNVYIGRQGIEKAYEKQLRGTKGVNYYQKDKFNRLTGLYKEGIYDTIFSPANDITLTIDLNLQTYGDSLMINKFGSIIAIEPHSGEILSLINAPTFDPNLLIGRDRSKNYINFDEQQVASNCL